MEIGGKLITDNGESRQSDPQDVCTKMTGSDAVALGKYRGFSLTLSYDGMKNEYRMTMERDAFPYGRGWELWWFRQYHPYG